MTERAWRVDTPVVVLKLVSDPLQHGTLGITRSLGRLGVPVHLALREVDTPAARSRYVAGRFVTPAPDGNQPATLAALLRIAEQVGSRPVLIPTDDVAALFVDAHAEALRDAFRFPAQPPGLPARLSDKRELHALVHEAGLPSPVARFPASREEMRAQAEELGYPVVMKSVDPVRLRSHARGLSVAIAPDAASAETLFERFATDDVPNLMLQEFIPGDSRSIWMFNGYLDAEGACRFGLVGRKVRQAPPDTGATSLGEIVANEEVRELAVAFLQRAGYRGIVDLGFRHDARDGRYLLLDVNPRIGSSFRLFVTPDGMDVARALYLDLTDQPLPEPATAHVGRRWWVENQDVGTSWRMLRRGDLGVRALLGSFRGVRESAWMARDDLRPALTMARASIGGALRRGGPRAEGPGQGDDGGDTAPSNRPMSGAAPS